MTFEEFDRTVFEISEIIIADKFMPDAVVAIARGGWIPARLLSKYLKVKRLYSFGVTYANDARTTLMSYDKPNPEIKNGKILLVEDYLESGKSMIFCSEQLVSAGNIVKTMAVGYRQKSLVVPDYTKGMVDIVPQLPWD